MKPPFAISLDFFASMDIMHRIEQPKTIYHMTSRENAKSILNDGFIHTGDDVCCWFFTDLKDIPLYLAITHSESKGRRSWDYDGRLHTAKPLDRNETVVLKLKPRYSEPEKWFIELVKVDSEDEIIGTTIDQANKLMEVFNRRLVHYGKMKFNTHPENIEIIELADVFNMRFEYTEFETELLLGA